MGGFLEAVASFPTVIFSVLLGVALVYWLLAILGLVDGDGHLLHADADADGTGHADVHFDGDDAGASDLGTLAGIAAALGLRAVPLSVALSAVALVAWMLCCLGALLLLPMLPSGGLQIAAGAILGLASLSIALPVAGQVVRPLRPLFVTHQALHNVTLVGQTCKVLTQTVDERVGRAAVAQRGASLNIRVWAPAPNRLARGASARIVSYDDATARYRIEAES